MRKKANFLAAALIAGGMLGLSAFSASAATMIDNSSSIDGAIGGFGAVDSATYGQTLLNLGGPDTVLTDFSMFLDGRPFINPGADSLDLRGYVAEWDGAKATNILYTSATQTMNAAGSFQEFAFSTGQLQLSAGTDYVFFISISELPLQAQSRFLMPWDSTGNSIDGGFVFLDNGTNFASLTSSDWNASFSDRDVRLKANFVAPIPIPAALPLLLSALGVFGFFGWRRRQTAAA